MAEALGVAASAISVLQLVGQVVSILSRLRGLWDQVERVPQQIRDLLDDAELLELIVSEIEDQFNPATLSPEAWNCSAARRCCIHVRGAIEALGQVVHRLDAEINSSKCRRFRHKIVAIRVILKKGSLDGLEKKLDQALRLLRLAVDCYLIVMTRVTHCTVMDIYTRIQHKSIPLNWKPGVLGLREHHTINERHCSRQRSLSFSTGLRRISFQPTFFGRCLMETLSSGKGYLVTLQLPSWLKQVIWEVELDKLYSGSLQFNIRCYNIRNSNSCIFEHAKHGDFSKMLTMFEKGEASPFDRDEDGWTLLHYAVWHGEVETCRQLLQLGLGVCIDEEVDDSWTPREMTTFINLDTVSGYSSAIIKNTEIMELFQYSTSVSYSDEDACAFLLMHASKSAEMELITQFQQRFAPTYYQLPLRKRLTAIRDYACDSNLLDGPPEIFKLLIRNPPSFCSEDLVASIKEELSLVHTVALALGSRAHAMQLHEAKRITTWESWLELFSEVVSMSMATIGGLHGTEKVIAGDDEELSWVGTPFLSLLQGACLFCPAEEDGCWEDYPRFALKHWLMQLRACGIELESYGRREKIIFENMVPVGARGLVLTLKIFYPSQLHWREFLIRLVGFDIGPEPDDWALFWEFVTDQPSRAMSEVDRNNVLICPKIPGSWEYWDE